MIERPLPPLLPLMPRRVPLGLTMWTRICRGAPCVIRTYSQLDAFWPDRLLLRDPSHWIVNEALIEGQPWLGAANGAVYSPVEWTRLPVREVPAGGEVQLSVTYVGSRDEGESFEAVLFGTEDRVPDPGPGIPTTPASRACVHARSVAVGEFTDVVRLSAPASGFCPDRLVIKDASDWAIEDVRVRGMSILTQEGGFAGEVFAGSGDDLPLRLGYLSPGEVVEVVASYVGERRPASMPLVAELSGPVARQPDRAEVCNPPTLIQPLCSGINILPYSSATLYGRPQIDRVPRGYGFLPERVVFANPRDWTVGDVKVGVRCQYSRGDDVPGIAFASDAVGVRLRLDPVRARVDFAVTATYVGARESGACFLGGVQGSLVRLAAP